jgi:chromosome segregation ATPase
MMPKSQKQKKSIRKRTTTKKRTCGADGAVITAPKTLRSRTRSGTEKLEDFADASEERASIISTVKGLEGQVETVFKLNEILEVQLDAAQNKLSEELAARVQSEVQAARRMEASEASKVTLERELSGTIQDAQALREEVEELRAKVEKLQDELTGADGRAADLRIQLEDQQATNRKLIETTTRLENEVKMVNINYDANKNELDAFKNAMRDIRSEASRTSGRVQQKYLQPKKKTNSSRKRS